LFGELLHPSKRQDGEDGRNDDDQAQEEGEDLQCGHLGSGTARLDHRRLVTTTGVTVLRPGEGGPERGRGGWSRGQVPYSKFRRKPDEGSAMFMVCLSLVFIIEYNVPS
jgi:hypothetical protein